MVDGDMVRVTVETHYYLFDSIFKQKANHINFCYVRRCKDPCHCAAFSSGSWPNESLSTNFVVF